ncbi:MAG: hypothetical protein JW849_07135 [Phycisphaerae bacterium]|nr:hypothetical protein [Phycisphaerae bacterium]
MNKSEHILIGLLTITGVLLGVLLIGSIHSRQAYAGTSSDRYGDYIMVPAARSDVNDLLYVIDVPNKKLLVYYCYEPNNIFKIVDDRVNLAEVFRVSTRPGIR